MQSLSPQLQGFLATPLAPTLFSIISSLGAVGASLMLGSSHPCHQRPFESPPTGPALTPNLCQQTCPACLRMQTPRRLERRCRYAMPLQAWVAFVITPALDLLLGNDLRNPTPAPTTTTTTTAAAAAAGGGAGPSSGLASPADLAYRAILYSYVAAHLTMLAGLVWLLSNCPLHPLAFLGTIISAGTAGGLLFTTAHELTHSSAGFDRFLASVLLATTCYMHWSQSHLAHHVKVVLVCGGPEACWG